MKTRQTICITRLVSMLFLATGLATGACTSSEMTDEVTPPREIDTGRRELLLTLKNKLALPGSATRGIATTAENQLSTLDVYVFGSETENGTYTFQECFSYRGDDAGNIPNKSTNLPLAVDTGDDSKTTGLLGLKNGAQANQGLQEGAFYSYASPEADGGYLVLKGLYQVNASEQKEVSYQIPFRQLGADGKETYLDIQHNHRYTIWKNASKPYEYVSLCYGPLCHN